MRKHHLAKNSAVLTFKVCWGWGQSCSKIAVRSAKHTRCNRVRSMTSYCMRWQHTPHWKI